MQAIQPYLGGSTEQRKRERKEGRERRQASNLMAAKNQLFMPATRSRVMQIQAPDLRRLYSRTQGGNTKWWVLGEEVMRRCRQQRLHLLSLLVIKLAGIWPLTWHLTANDSADASSKKRTKKAQARGGAESHDQKNPWGLREG